MIDQIIDSNAALNKKPYTKKQQEILAEIEITKADLYVFKGSDDGKNWENLLNEAKNAILASEENNLYANKLIREVRLVIDHAWKRIFRWQKLQSEVIGSFAFLLIVELFIVGIFYNFIEIAKYGFLASILFGFLGGLLSVAQNLGEDMKFGASNHLLMSKLILRPFIGSASAVVAFLLLRLNVIAVAPQLDPISVLIVVSIFAGYSERFITKMFNAYLPDFIYGKEEKQVKKQAEKSKK